MKVKFVKLDPSAVIPSKGKPKDMDYDLTSIEAAVMQPGDIKRIRTGIAAMLPSNGKVTVGALIRGRSSLAMKGITPLGGEIDNTYTGEIMVVLANVGRQTQWISAGDRIAQLRFVNYVNVDIEEAETIDQVTERNADGFGSTGK